MLKHGVYSLTSMEEPKDAFVVGHKYKFTKDPRDILGTDPRIKFDSDEFVFTCHDADCRGDAWTMDVSFHDMHTEDGQGWCVASTDMLRTGDVVEVDG